MQFKAYITVGIDTEDFDLAKSYFDEAVEAFEISISKSTEGEYRIDVETK